MEHTCRYDKLRLTKILLRVSKRAMVLIASAYGPFRMVLIMLHRDMGIHNTLKCTKMFFEKSVNICTTIPVL